MNKAHSVKRHNTNLAPDGILALEIDERRSEAVRALGKDYGWDVTIQNDVFGCPRYALSIKED